MSRPPTRALAAEAVGAGGLLANAVASVAALGVLVAVLAPVSGAHLNPAVSLAQAVRGDLPWAHLPGYVLAQVGGALAGTVLANLMYELPALSASTTERGGAGQWLGEVVATAGLLMVVGFVSRGRPALAPPLVAGWILAAYWFTSSTSFANPAVTLARSATDTFAGIAPASVPGFVLAQLVGVGAGLLLMSLVAPQPDPGRVPRWSRGQPSEHTTHGGAAPVDPRNTTRTDPGSTP